MFFFGEHSVTQAGEECPAASERRGNNFKGLKELLENQGQHLALTV